LIAGGGAFRMRRSFIGSLFMADAIPFNRTFDAEPGEVVRLTPNLRRVTAPNSSMFTFKGTNTYIVGNGNVAVVDPGPVSPEQAKAIMAAVAGETVTHIIATHTHNDHSPGIPAIKLATGAPTHGFGPHGVGARRDWPFDSPEGGDKDFTPDHLVADGEVIQGDGWSLEAIHTPGHISNHLCFALKEDNVLLSGDHVMGWSTSIVSPPDGDMNHYMASLRKLLDRGETTYYPGHGGPVEDPAAFVKAFITHREAREDQIRACLKDGPKSIPAMVSVMYADVDPGLHRAAGRSVLSHLLAMWERGEVTCPDTPPGPDSTFQLS
jgi:glyoxylase-like metal-dependent hydrolase (beta-lactamase superfamily II)